MALYPLRSLLAAIFALTSTVIYPVAGQVCSHGLYKDLLILSTFPLAERYCSANFPLPTSTVTVTVTPGTKLKRATTTSSTQSNTKSTTKTTTAATTSAAVAPAALLASAQGKGKAFISTLCSCIEKQQTVTVTSTAAAPTCTSGLLTGNNAGCTYFVFCDETFVPLSGSQPNSGLTPIYSQQPNIDDCKEQCDSDFMPALNQYIYCRAFNYYFTNQTCVIFQEETLGLAFYQYDQPTPGVAAGETNRNGLCVMI